MRAILLFGHSTLFSASILLFLRDFSCVFMFYREKGVLSHDIAVRMATDDSIHCTIQAEEVQNLFGAYIA